MGSLHLSSGFELIEEIRIANSKIEQEAASIPGE
jgi:hypothetical protein